MSREVIVVSVQCGSDGVEYRIDRWRYSDGLG